jgi:hypothetical protein
MGVLVIFLASSIAGAPEESGFLRNASPVDCR